MGLVAQIAFVASWLIAASWQGPHYSSLEHSISDMYAVGAPYGAFLVVVFTLCGDDPVRLAFRAAVAATCRLDGDRGVGPARFVHLRPGRPAQPVGAGGVPAGRCWLQRGRAVRELGW